jgi:UDP-GlcNAc:undecaprenyl-phosphate/decaprenyl-phosphate GlcNAc-1-phosphate transferase
MKASLLSFTVATVTSASLTPLVRNIAVRRGALDQASGGRKVHVRPTPRLGGIAIVAAFLLPLIALFFVDSEIGRRFYGSQLQSLGMLVGGIAIAALGIYDDLKGANAKLKFLVQFGVALVMYWCGFQINRIATPFGMDIELGALALPFTMLWIAGVINAVNLIDGLDGLAGGIALIAVTSTGVIAALRGDALTLLVTATLAGAVLGFLRYNFNPASIFMGDTGSMFLGFVLATTGVRANVQASTAVSVLVPILALGIPITDTLLAMARRAASGVPLFSADRGHIHHRLLDVGLSHRQTVLLLYGVSAVLGAAAVVVAYLSSAVAVWVLLAVATVAYLGLRRLGYIDIDATEDLLARRRRNAEIRSAIRRVGNALRQANSVPEVWGAVRMGAAALGTDGVALRLRGFPSRGEDALAHGFDGSPGGQLRTRHPLFGERAIVDYLEFGWNDGRVSLDRDTEIAAEMLCDQVSVALQRISWTSEQAVASLARADG